MLVTMTKIADGCRYVRQLPYAHKALEPFMSCETVTLHYEVHHKGYEKKLLSLLSTCTELLDCSIQDILNTSYQQSMAGDATFTPIYNNAAQIVNHNTFWESLSPSAGKVPECITTTFGSYEKFKERFVAKSLGVFGSGWCWLIVMDGKLAVETTAPAFNPANTHPGCRILLGIDLWEHSYYLDYRQDRAKYVASIVDNLVDWDRVLSDSGIK